MKPLTTFLLLLSLWAGPADSHAAAPLQLRIFNRYESLDWQLQLPRPHRYLLMNLMSGLFTFNRELQLVPAQAATTAMSSDGVTFTINLKNGLKWSDGVRVVAEDYLRSWNRARKAPEKFGLRWLFDDVRQMKALDPATIQIILKRPDRQFLYRLALPATFPLRPEHLITKFKTANFPVTGPYRLASWDQKNALYTLAKNSNFPVTNKGPETVVVRTIPVEVDAQPFFDRGELDVLSGVDTNTIGQLAESSKARFMSYELWYLDYLFFNFRSNYANSRQLRSAISLAIDTATLSKALNSGQRPGTSFILKGMFGYTGPQMQTDLVRARALFKEWRESKDGAPSEPFRILYYESKVSRKLAHQLSQVLKESLGLEVNSLFVPLLTYDKALAAGKYDAALFYYNPESPIPDDYLKRFENSNQSNYGHYDNSSYMLALKALREAVVEKRGPIYKELEETLLEKDFAVVPLTEAVLPTLISARVHEVWISPLYYLWLPDVRMLDF